MSISRDIHQGEHVKKPFPYARVPHLCRTGLRLHPWCTVLGCFQRLSCLNTRSGFGNSSPFPSPLGTFIRIVLLLGIEPPLLHIAHLTPWTGKRAGGSSEQRVNIWSAICWKTTRIHRAWGCADV